MAERHINLCINVSLRHFVKIKVSEEEDGASVPIARYYRAAQVTIHPHFHHPKYQLTFISEAPTTGLKKQKHEMVLTRDSAACPPNST